MLKRFVLLTLVLALVAPASASAEVTIKVGGSKYREVLYPGSFRIKGKTGTYRGAVKLEVDEFPFDGAYADGGTVNTTDKGEYVFPNVAPTRNARIRARAGSEVSKATTVFVHPGVKRKERLVADFRVKVSFAYLGHPGFAPPADSFFVYMIKNREKRITRLGGARTMAQIGDGRWRFSGIVKLPSGRNYKYGLLYCTRGLSAAGYGRFYRIDRSCGDKVIPFPNGY
ncbi:MAG TPA: hypothetical protein VF517_16090 [Thermoleophilaceae bacterium]|jgi:hypothetical protein